MKAEKIQNKLKEKLNLNTLLTNHNMTTINTVKTTLLPILDGIELKTATFKDISFPLHFHQNWSLAYIESGSENIAFNGLEFLLNKNAYVLIPPNSLHKNWGNKNNSWTYKALYLDSDIVKKAAQKLNIDYSLLASFPYFISYGAGQLHLEEESILMTLENLFCTAICSISDGATASTAFMPIHEGCCGELIAYLHINYNSKITLDGLEQEFRVNKYKLLKKFKKEVGLTPLEYQTALRIEESKQLFYQDISLTHIALESGFYDQSHFTHCFKKYVGVTPGAYKQNSNILQDY